MNDMSDICEKYPKQIMTCIMDIGETLLRSGAEVMRVEDTLKRLCGAYGFIRADVFTITSCIMLTTQTPDRVTHSQIRRVISRGTDLEKVARANDLSRRVCAGPPPLEELREWIKELDATPQYSRRTNFLMYGAVGAVFTVFFGGTWLDAAAGGMTGLLLFCSVQLCGRLRMNGILQNTVCSAFAAFVILILCRLGLGVHEDKIMIGNIMLLIPGLALTTSLRDMINGDTLSGLMGFCEAIIKALAIAIGSAAVLNGLGGVI